MKPLGLGEHGGLTIVREGRAFVAYLRYRDYSGRGRRIKRSGRSRAEASREVLKAVKQALGADGGDESRPGAPFMRQPPADWRCSLARLSEVPARRRRTTRTAMWSGGSSNLAWDLSAWVK